MSVPLSQFASGLKAETAFDVLAIAKSLKARGKDVVELQIGDSPFPTPEQARQAGIAAIENHESHYCSSLGLDGFRQAAAESMNAEYGLELAKDNIVAGPGAKIFEQFFCETFLSPDDEVLVFTPQFPTYLPNIQRRQATAVFSRLDEKNEFRPSISDVESFVKHPCARAIFLNSPHNPTGGVATEEDVRKIAALIAGRPIALFSDEPYHHMVWRGKHAAPLAHREILDQCVAAYTFSKSYSMSGWRIGFAVTSQRIAEVFGKLANTTISCVPPIAQHAAIAALKFDKAERDKMMRLFGRKVTLLVEALQRIGGMRVRPPAGAFYVFPNVSAICNRLGMTSHGLAMFLLEAADDHFGVACLGGECYGEAGHGFLRFHCAEPDERILEAARFIADAVERTDRATRFLSRRPEFCLPVPYPAMNT